MEGDFDHSYQPFHSQIMTASPQSSPSLLLRSFISLEQSHHPASTEQTLPTGPFLFPRDVFTIQGHHPRTIKTSYPDSCV